MVTNRPSSDQSENSIFKSGFFFYCDFIMFLATLLNSMKAAESLSDLPNWMPVLTEMTLLILMPYVHNGLKVFLKSNYESYNSTIE